MNGLLEQYGDVEVGRIYDYWKSRMIGPDGRYIRNEECMVGSVTISMIMDNIKCRSEYERIIDIINGRCDKPMYPADIPESKAAYESTEQEMARKKHHKEWGSAAALMGIPYTYHAVEHFYDTTHFADPSPTPKQFGMAMDNHRKRH